VKELKVRDQVKLAETEVAWNPVKELKVISGFMPTHYNMR